MINLIMPLDFVDLWTVLLIVMLTLLFRAMIGPRNLPPGPKGLPFIGAMLQFRDPKNLHKDFMSLSKRYGEVFSYYKGRQLFVVLNSYSSIREVLQTRGGDFGGRPLGPFESSRKLQDEMFRGIYSEKWKKNKLFASKTAKAFGFGTNASEDKIIREIDELIDFIEQQNGSPVDLKILNYTAMNIMLSVNLNIRFSWYSKVVEDLAESLTQRNYALLEAFDIDLTLAQCIPFFILKWFKSDTMKRLSECDVVFREFITKQIDFHRKTYDPDNMRDFLDCYLRHRPDLICQDKAFVDTSMGFFIDGVEALASLVRYMLLYLMYHPHEQERARKLIDDVVGGGKPRLEHRPKLVYIDAIIYESLRLSCIFPILPLHGAIKNTTLYCYTIPKDNTFILPNVYAVQMDPEIFPEPEKFKPSHFLQDGNLVNTKYVLQFGNGARQCIGTMMAKIELFLFVCHILQRFTVKPPEDDPGKFTDMFTPDPTHFGIRPRHFKICAIPR